MRHALSDKALIKISLSYPGNLGFQEMVKFYQIANDNQIKELEYYLENNDSLNALALMKEVTQTELEDF